jgi:hypothetical protein
LCFALVLHIVINYMAYAVWDSVWSDLVWGIYLLSDCACMVVVIIVYLSGGQSKRTSCKLAVNCCKVSIPAPSHMHHHSWLKWADCFFWLSCCFVNAVLVEHMPSDYLC